MNFWTQKPPLGTRINWGHPLARGLVGCWLLNEGVGWRVCDLINKNILSATTVSGNSWKLSNFGSGLSFTGSYSGYCLPSIPSSLRISFPLTFVFDFTFTAGGDTNYPALAGVAWRGDSNTSPYSCYGFGGDNTVKNNFGWNNAGTSGSTALITTPIGRNHQVGVATSGFQGHYINGVLVASGTAALTTPSYHALSQLHIGGATSWAHQATITAHNMLIYNRALSYAEITYLYAFPYCMIERPAYPVWMATAVAATGSLLIHPGMNGGLNLPGLSGGLNG
jgi:hypothetical protein